MTKPADPGVQSLSVDCLRFFGAMSASVSHEIRNKLAVINEKAGLVEDIAVAMKSGRVPDPERLETQARKIVEQVREANRIVRSLNRLAHSTDEVVATVDLSALVDLVIELYGRKAAMAQATVSRRAPADEIPIRTHPFLLAHAIGHCLGAAVSRVDASRELTVTTERTDAGARVRIGPVVGAAAGDAEPDRDAADPGALLDVLGAELTDNAEAGELVLDIGHSQPHDHGGLP
ncbi:MAG: sensor histidine kinase [Holophagae bacterium]|jgi:C4-dicarboxylate-specific signal transduction histidine kinase